jgi:hypothetical protein
MPDTKFQLEIDGAPLERDDLTAVIEVQAEEASDQADALTIVGRVHPGDDGEWKSVLDPLTLPQTPVVLQLERDSETYRFDGLSCEAEWRVDAEGTSRLAVKAIDRSLEMDMEEKVVAWPGTSDSGIAESIFRSYGFSTRIEDTPKGPDPDVHVAMQRATDWSFLRSIAAKWGYSAYLECSGEDVVGHFHPIDPLDDPVADLSLAFGGDATQVEVRADLVAGERVVASRIPTLSDTPQVGDSPGDDEPQGLRSLGGQATVLLAPADIEGEIDPIETTAGAARRSAFGVQLSVEVDTDVVGSMLRARRTIFVKGLGDVLSGRYLARRVRNVVTTERHLQQLTLDRNALGVKPFESVTRGLEGLFA